MNGNKFAKELDFAILPVSPIKYISIGDSCFTSYSAIACRHAPHGGIGVDVLFFFEPAVIAIFKTLASVINSGTFGT